MFPVEKANWAIKLSIRYFTVELTVGVKGLWQVRVKNYLVMNYWSAGHPIVIERVHWAQFSFYNEYFL